MCPAHFHDQGHVTLLYISLLPNFLCTGNVPECRVSCVLIFSFMPPNLVIVNVPEMSCVLAERNVPEMSCVLAKGNPPQLLLYTLPGNVKEMSKFPGVGNVHTMNRKFELSYTFHGISWPRKFKISFSVRIWHCMFLQDLEDLDTTGSYKILQDLAGLQEKGPFLVRSCKSVFTGYFVI